MRPFTALTRILAVGLAASGASSDARAQTENVIVSTDFAGTQRDGLTSTVLIRRGVTTRVQIIKDLIDLVPFGQVSTTSGPTPGGISNGRTQNGQGMGFIAMDLAPSSNLAVGSTFKLKVGLIDQFNFKVVHRGQIASVTRTPDPSTIPSGTPWVATITGTDLGGIVVQPIACHTIAHNPRSATSVTVTLTRNTTCSTNAFGIGLIGSSANDPPTFRTSNGQNAGFQFQYAPQGVACVSAPGIGIPVITRPSNNQVIQFRPATSSPTNVVIAWDSLTTSAIAAPNNEWLVTKVAGKPSPITVIGSRPTGTVTTVRALSTTLSLAIPGTHTVSIRAKNCGQSSPSATITFTTAYQ